MPSVDFVLSPAFTREVRASLARAAARRGTPLGSVRPLTCGCGAKLGNVTAAVCPKCGVLVYRPDDDATGGSA